MITIAFVVDAGAEDVVARAMIQSLRIFFNEEEVQFVDDPAAADIILLQSHYHLEKIHRFGVQFLLLVFPGKDKPGQVQENVTIVPQALELISVVKALSEVITKVKEHPVDKTPEPTADGPRVLVIDDKEIHCESAWRLLGADTRLTVVTTYRQGIDALKLGWDAVLTDLNLPASSETLGKKAVEEHAGQEAPLGFVIALLAAEAGVPKIAVVTDQGHHDHPMSAAFDRLDGTFTINGSKVRFSNRWLSKDGKDWRAALEALHTT
jgi:CheY-like chemotaxis protein